MSVETPERTVVVTRAIERQQAGELLGALEGHADRLSVIGGRATVPVDLAAIIGKVLEVVANGGTVTIASMPEELTTTVAAEQLGVSRPTLMKMIRNGEIPAHKVGSHHRIKFVDVQKAKRARLARQAAALEELRRLEDELENF